MNPWTVYLITDLLRILPFIVLLVYLLIKIYKITKKNVKIRIICSLIITLIIIIPIISVSVDIFEIYLDVKNEAFIIYSGDYEQTGPASSGMESYVSLIDSDVNVRCPRGRCSEGKYNGYVVYLERTKIVIYHGETLDNFSPENVFD